MATATKRERASKGFYRALEERTRFKPEKLTRKRESKADKTRFYPIEVSMGQYTVLFFILNTVVLNTMPTTLIT